MTQAQPLRPFSCVLAIPGSDAADDPVVARGGAVAQWFDVLHRVEPREVAPVVAEAAFSAPSLTVAPLDEVGVGVAAASRQPTMLLPTVRRPRLDAGPLMVGVSGGPADFDAIALAAIWALALQLEIRLVLGTGPDVPVVAHQMGLRLHDLGISATEEMGSWTDAGQLVAAGASLQTTAVVVSAESLTVDLSAAAEEANTPLLIAPIGSEGTLSAAPPEPVTADLVPETVEHAPGLSILTRDECFVRLDQTKVGRLGYIDNGWPVVVPVNFRLSGDDIFLRSLPGGKLAAAQDQQVVCFEIDGVAEDDRAGWSVLLQGRLEQISDPALLSRAWRNDPDPFAAGDQWQWLRIVPFTISGREINGW